MGKNHRGKGLKDVPAHGRGTCPACKKTGIKIIHELKVGDKTVKLCKYCHATDPAKLNLA